MGTAERAWTLIGHVASNIMLVMSPHICCCVSEDCSSKMSWSRALSSCPSPPGLDGSDQFLHYKASRGPSANCFMIIGFQYRDVPHTNPRKAWHYGTHSVRARGEIVTRSQPSKESASKIRTNVIPRFARPVGVKSICVGRRNLLQHGGPIVRQESGVAKLAVRAADR